MKIKKQISKKYLQDLQKVADQIKISPVAILIRVFDMSVQSLSLNKAKTLSHRQLASASKELKLFSKREVKLPFRHCPYCTSTRILLQPYIDFRETKCICLTCKRQIKYEELEGGDRE